MWLQTSPEQLFYNVRTNLHGASVQVICLSEMPLFS